jgi:hypothetical protein
MNGSLPLRYTPKMHCAFDKDNYKPKKIVGQQIGVMNPIGSPSMKASGDAGFCPMTAAMGSGEGT